jgi:FHS family L-fucose permease-like MFS transporter
LQVAANPYVSVLGEPETASSRLTMTQAFNSLGTTVAPFFGAWLIFGGMEVPVPVAGAVTESTVQLPYIILAVSLVLLAIIFAWLKLPAMGKKDPTEALPLGGEAWKQRHLMLGALGMPEIGGMSKGAASHYIAWYFGGAMLGRFIGAVVMQKVNAGKALAFNAVCAVLLIALTILSSGKLAMWSLLLVGLCNSIMFPTIFSLAIAGLKQYTGQGSGILCLAIVGGAILPLLQGVLADNFGVQQAFILPLLCYIYIAFYGLNGCKPRALIHTVTATKEAL